ncbi:GIY-YIG nuclease family protein [Colwellia sp. 1_MG-2023]|uniref:GIY-YIG nuclease family protein n=1 Tax=Colwellia sp. 1_MG-2023 TaxID=3062649 RepID=UPI0026E3A0B7|nr:GIY-YIG nuclease family protein [Colwellia sp. 1_MG-2023]MDO6447517.1 GIY-YIG nuclease family protein [Colwellia sp. 1_MG-2023]
MNEIKEKVSKGNVYVMRHSLFSDVIRIGCTPESPNEYAKTLSKTTPGEYQVVFQLYCDNPCQIKKQVREYLDAKKYVNEFYQVSPEIAEKLLKTESLKIPIILA